MGSQNKNYEMGGTRGGYGEGERCIEGSCGNIEGKRPLG